MNINELKELQNRIIVKNKKCNLIVSIIVAALVLSTIVIMVISKARAMHIIIASGFELVFGLVSLVIIKLIVNGKDTSKFDNEFKNTFVLNALKNTFDDLNYNIEEGFDEETLSDYGMIDTADRYSSNDYISGTYKGIKFEQSDVHIEEEHESEDSDGNKTVHWVTIFRGRYMIFDFNKKFMANVQVVSNHFGARSSPRDKNFSRIKLEDMEFNKMFDVYTDIEHDAFYILTPHFMQKIKDLYKNLDSPIMLCFVDNRLHIALDNGEDSFEYNVFKPINEEEINKDIIKDIKLITDFVNELNLDNDLFRR